MYQKLLALSLAAVMLAACSEEQAEQAQPESVCSDPAIVQSVRNTIQDVIKQEARAFARNDSRQFVDADKIIAAGSELEIALDEAEAVREGSKVSCSARLKIRIPGEIMDAAQTNSPLIYGEVAIDQLIGQKVMGSRLNYADNEFSTTLRYVPAQNGANFQDNLLSTTAQTVSAALLPYGVKSMVMIDGRAVSKEEALRLNAGGPYAEPPQADPEDILENNAASRTEGVPAGSDAFEPQPELLSPRADDTVQVPALAQSDLDNARVQNRQAEADITGVWNGLDRAVQQNMLSEQRSWIQSKSQNCMQAAAAADNPARAEYLQLQCDTRMTRERTQYLRGFSINN